MRLSPIGLVRNSPSTVEYGGALRVVAGAVFDLGGGSVSMAVGQLQRHCGCSGRAKVIESNLGQWSRVPWFRWRV